jgi:hypothetical protein
MAKYLFAGVQSGIEILDVRKPERCLRLCWKMCVQGRLKEIITPLKSGEGILSYLQKQQVRLRGLACRPIISPVILSIFSPSAFCLLPSACFFTP